MQSKNEQILQSAERMLVAATVALVPLFHWPWIGGGDPFTTAKTVLLAGLVGLLAILRASQLMLSPHAPKPLWGISVWGGLVVVWAGISLWSLLMQPNPAHFFRMSLLQWIFLLYIWLLGGMAMPERFLRRLLIVLVACGTAVAMIGIVQFIHPQSLARFLPYAGAAGDVRHQIFSTVGNPEYLGGYLAGILVLTFGWLSQSRHWRWWLLLVPAAMLQMVALMRTGARGAWIGAMAGLAVIVAVELKRRHSFKRLLLVLTVLISLATGLLVLFSTANPLNPYRANFLRRMEELRNPQSESVRHRLALLIGGSRMIRKNPWLGVGPGHFPNAYFEQLEEMNREDASGAVADYLSMLKGRNPDHAHNDPLEIWAETGTLGLMAFLALIAYGLALLVRRSLRGDELAGPILICLAFSLTMLVESLFSFPLHLPTRGALFWTVFALGAMASMDRSESAPKGSADADTLSAECL